MTDTWRNDSLSRTPNNEYALSHHRFLSEPLIRPVEDSFSSPPGLLRRFETNYTRCFSLIPIGIRRFIGADSVHEYPCCGIREPTCNALSIISEHNFEAAANERKFRTLSTNFIENHRRLTRPGRAQLTRLEREVHQARLASKAKCGSPIANNT